MMGRDIGQITLSHVLIEVIMGYHHLLVEIFVIQDSGVFLVERLQGYHELFVYICVIQHIGMILVVVLLG